MSETKHKGDIGVAMIVADLTSRGYPVLIPAYAQHLRYDLVADVNGRLLKIQCKFRAALNGVSIPIKASTSWSNAQGSHTIGYEANDFDVLAVWCPDVARVLYLPWMKQFACINIAIKPVPHVDYYWWEDFLSMPAAMPSKRAHIPSARKASAGKRKIAAVVHSPRPRIIRPIVPWPDDEVLRSLVWKRPTTQIAKELGVSDKAVEKRCKKRKIDKPPRGFWASGARGSKNRSMGSEAADL